MTVILGLIFGIIFTTMHAYADDSQFIPWSENRKLVWGDFNGVAHEYPKEYKRQDPHHIAFTWGEPRLLNFHHIKAESIICQYQITNVDVLGFFNKNQSWTTDQARFNPTTLIHEQGHFDIIEIYARKIKSDLLFKVVECPDKKYNATLIDAEIRKMASTIGKETQKMHDQYDDELGRGSATQQDWDMRIKRELSIHPIIQSSPDNSISEMTTTVGPEKATCKFGWKVMKKNSDHSLVCLTPAASSVLEKRGWGKIWEYSP